MTSTDTAATGGSGHSQGRGGWRVARWLALGVAVLGIGLGIVFAGRLDQDPTLIDSPLIGEPAPTREVPELEDDGTFSLEELRGDVVVVNFWASWCTTCRAEHPHLLAAAETYTDRDVSFVGVNFQDRNNAATDYLDEHGRGEEQVYGYVDDPNSRLALDFGVFGVPETFFIDPEGTIVAKITGESTYELLTSTIDDILAGEDPDSHDRGPVTPAPEQ
ncbi:redoxin domain-containing protein [Haloechinothrix sp. LS1_15]|uniref:TlpA family protein disulfide reductase n=1 Tax=Haloechinothrix sp. LS1_15 TaxID=2652248 RepID=UPI0029442A70|nr:redoxin domain-containing protein [Haloechinothrix sp. LS1_15]MDV6011851.1 redoxin domain-containing protein [Haloechinothrix sp. LS1_15]